MLTKGTTPFFCSLALYPHAMSSIQDIDQYDYISSTQFFILDTPWLIAPMLEQGKSTRDVFFPDYRKINSKTFQSSYWIDFYRGIRHNPGSV